MANVIVDEMRCLVGSDEVGSDDIYLMTFRGHIPPEIRAPRRLILPAADPSTLLHFTGDRGRYWTVIKAA
ncbi:hypothetical protein [Nocardia gipuzkoensis]|uniref:hypothetical protein n=1 Tax=Nocardia gipuzkoensis TaxID=2749991 RepID=UPI0015EFD582|nr:hypothetical protein [Nocardia gipuzkoensis]